MVGFEEMTINTSLNEIAAQRHIFQANLARLPSHWSVGRLKYYVTINPEVLPETTDPSYLIKYIDISSISDVSNTDSQQELIFENAPSRARRIIKPGDVIISTVRTYLKAIAFFDRPPENLIVSTGFAVLRAGYKIHPKFLGWLVNCNDFISNVVASSKGVSYPAINPSELANLPIWVPPISEQRTITKFLDRQTAKIDALIAKKQRLIELLQEKRTALISQAVTKGLNPDVPMKDSGIEWLGEIPEHWEIKKLKHLATIIISNVDKHKKDDEIPVRLCNYTDVYYKEYITNDLDFMVATALPNEIEKFAMNKGSILITKDSETWDDIAIPAYVPHDLKEVICGYHLALIHPNLEIIDGIYLFRSFQSNTLNHQFKISANGITRYGLSKSSIDKSIFLVPPLEEQRCITTFIEEKTGKINKLIELNKQGITKLKDYKIALISAAVTGKIDVRGLVS